jgi:uncharacterized protein YndB with AHSA1/START domain
MNIHSTSDRILRIERRFEAPRDVVFSLWTHPKHIIRWWGPRGFGLSRCEQDFRVGGNWRVHMENGEITHWVWGRYREIQPPERLVFSYSMDILRYETLITLDFEADGDATIMRFTQAEFLTEEDAEGHHIGWASTLSMLADYVLQAKGAGLLKPDLYANASRDELDADYAEAAARAQKQRAEDAAKERETV